MARTGYKQKQPVRRLRAVKRIEGLLHDLAAPRTPTSRTERLTAMRELVATHGDSANPIKAMVEAGVKSFYVDELGQALAEAGCSHGSALQTRQTVAEQLHAARSRDVPGDTETA